MIERLFQNWVYGGALAGILLVILAPLLVPSLGAGGLYGYLALIAYMLHQYEEHDHDRFRQFVNKRVAVGRRGLSVADVFIINVPGVWGVIALSMWLAERAALGWALIAAWLMVVNALAHSVQAVAMRRYNPGLVTAVVLFVPLGGWILVSLWPVATFTQNATSLVIVLLIHIGIVFRAMRPAASA